MLVPLVYSFISLHPLFCVRSEAAQPSGPDSPPWFVGCFTDSDSSFLSLYSPKGAHDLDPGACCARCLDEGYQFALMIFQSCYCGNQQPKGLALSECLNASYSGGESERQSGLHLPVGGRQGIVALYRTEGPFLHSINLSSSVDKVQVGKAFQVEVSGNLAGSPSQPSGLGSLRGQDLSYVTVDFLNMTHGGQSSHHVRLLDDGSFVASSEWILETPGKYEINVRVSNLLSMLSSTLHLSVLQPFPDSLVISVLHGPLGVPSCLQQKQQQQQQQQTGSHSAGMQAAYLGVPVTLQAYMGETLATEFCWWFTHQKKQENKEVVEERKAVKTVCSHNSECLTNMLNWTFEAEGVHSVSVNASNASGWTQQTIHVVVVRPGVSDLKVSVSTKPLKAGESIPVDVELLTNMNHNLLFLSLTLNAEYDHNHEQSVNLSSRPKEINTYYRNKDINSHSTHSSDTNNNTSNETDNSAASTNANKSVNYTGKITHWKRNDHQASNYGDHENINLNRNQSDFYCYGDSHSYLHHLIPLHLLHNLNQSSCRLHIHLHCELPITAGQYYLTASVMPTPDRSSVLFSTVLSPALVVNDHICGLKPSGRWLTVISTNTTLSLEVTSHGSTMGSRVTWTFSLESAVVINRTTEEWSISLLLPLAGQYNVTVKAFNLVSSSSFQTHMLAQDVVGELVMIVPNVIRTNQKYSLFFRVTEGSNITVSLLVDRTLVYRNSSYTAGEEAGMVLLFNHTRTIVVELRAENQVSSQNKSVKVYVEGNRKASSQSRVNPDRQPPTSQSSAVTRGDNVQIYAEKQAYPTNTEITFLAVADKKDVEFIWHFGDSTLVRTSARTVTKRYRKPGRFDVVVVMTDNHTSITSEVFPLMVQRAVKLNRLVHLASVLRNQTMSVSCRVNVGANLTFLWIFGDGATKLGQSTEWHNFHRTGEFRVEVTVSNLVSSASLSSIIFVVDQPCQPPPVKNMGPHKLQVRRDEVIHLGVTYETEIDCDVSGGLHYTWSLFDSAGQIIHLRYTDTHRQSLTLKNHLLHYDIYTAIARVQVIGSVVYSNYSVRVQVIPSPPVAVIKGGTNIFINTKKTTIVTLDGQSSYDPDFPMNPLSYSWTCKPLSSITTSCFNQYIPTSSAVLMFPISLLKHDFDQFQFTLTIYSGERSAASETFLTVTPNLLRKVSLYCSGCQGNQVNWDHSFSVSTLCEDCDVSINHIQYSWSLYLVNASSRPVMEVPFCYAADLGAPSTIIQGPTSFPQTLGTSTLHPSDTSKTVHPTLLTEVTSETRARKRNLGRTDSGTSSKKSRHVSNKAGDEPFYHFLRTFYSPEHHTSTTNPPLIFDTSQALYSEHFGQNYVISEFPVHSDSSAEWGFSFPVLESGDLAGHPDSDYDVPFQNAQEGDSGISAGRPTDVNDETFSPEIDDSLSSMVFEEDGSNLVLPRPNVVIQESTLLDLPRDRVDRGLFESYTSTGISSPLLSFRPFSLRPGNRYMLEFSAKSHHSILGRTQLFLQTKPAPKGMTCQVQPPRGMELHTHFSIFCTSGKEDLLYKHSFRVGSRDLRVLYTGRDFQYYFSLPSGDPNDDYKVTIYTEIRSSTFGAATKPCPVTVQVQPSFPRDTSSPDDPVLELSASGLRNLSAVMRLRNSQEIRNYISLLTSILNRLSMNTTANTHAQRHLRNVLIGTVCELESSDQASMVDSICILKDLLQVTNQVALTSVRQVKVHTQTISDHFWGSSTQVQYHLAHRNLNNLIALLSYMLQAVVTSHDSVTEMVKTGNITQVLESDSLTGEKIRNTGAFIYGCKPPSSTSDQGSSASKVAELVVDILQTASQLMLKYLLFHKVQEHRLFTDLAALYATYQNQTSSVLSSGSTTVYLPASLIQLLFLHHSEDTESGQHQPCVLSVLTEFTISPLTCAQYPTQLSRPMVDLSLYTCSRRRRISLRSLVVPVNIELKFPPGNKSSVHEHILLRSRVHYHSFNITQDHLQQAIQLSVVFTPPPGRVFPIMLLFRMFEKPTPSMHHLRLIHHWEATTIRLTLPPSYLNAAGIGHLALLSADFERAPRHKPQSEQISYSLTAISSLCLSWDVHQGAWTHQGCRTQQADTDTAVNCSCHQLRPLTVVQHQIQSNHDTADLDLFLSVSCDLTVLGVLLLSMCFYFLGLPLCKRADNISEKNQRVYYLSDNSPLDLYKYAVTIHTGLCSAANMSAKVYIVLYGEDGVSNTRELQVPGFTMFRRNSRDTFIVRTAKSLGSVWGAHIWHDGSGPSAAWYLREVEVTEVNRGKVKGRSWLFFGQCWLAVNKGDGQLEKMLHVCTHGLGFVKMLCFKLSNYLADFHIWMSVYSCPHPNLFTHTQRFSVCLLLLLGYGCVNTIIISQMNEELPLESGIFDLSAVSLTTGVLSVVAVLPGATMISFLFRLNEVKLMRSGVQRAKDRRPGTDCFEDGLSANDSILHLSWSSLKKRIQEAWRKKYQGTDQLSTSSTSLEKKDSDKEPFSQPDVIIIKEHGLAVDSRTGPALQNMLLISQEKNADQSARENEFVSSESSKVRGLQRDLLSLMMDEDEITQNETESGGMFSSDCGFEEDSHHQAALGGHNKGRHKMDRLKGGRVGQTTQWCHYPAWVICLLMSLSCLVLSAVLGMRFSRSKVLLWIHSLFFSLMSCIFFIHPTVILIVAVIVALRYRNRPDFHTFSRVEGLEVIKQPEEQFSMSARPQERHSDLEKLLAARQRARYLRLVRPPTLAEFKKTRLRKRRETLIHQTLRDLSVCVFMAFLMLCVTYGSSVSDHFHLNDSVRKQFIRNDNNFMTIQKHEDWWNWTQTSILNLLQKNTSVKTERSHILIGEVTLWKKEASSSFSDQSFSGTHLPDLSGRGSPPHPHIVTASSTTCGLLSCYSWPSTTVGLGHTKSGAASKLNFLVSHGWLNQQTVALKVQFTIFSPAPNLFTTVTLLAERSPTNTLLPSSKVQSVRVYHTPSVWDYVVMLCQLLFFFLSLLQLCHQVCTMRQQGLMGYWRTPCNWLETSLVTVILVYYVYVIYRSIIMKNLVEVLQRHRGQADVGFLAAWEQDIRSLHGVILFLLAMKCVTVWRVNKTMTTSARHLPLTFSSLFWPTISVLILLLALSCAGNLLFGQSSWAFSSIRRSLQTLLCHRWGPRAARAFLLSELDFFHCGALYLSSTVVWTAVGVGVFSSLVRSARRSQNRRGMLAVAELSSYIRRRISEFTGRHEPSWIDQHVKSRTYYLEEFEILIDELLFRLDVMSNYLQHTLPLKAHHYMEESPNMDIQNFLRKQMTEETRVNYHTDSKIQGETRPPSYMSRSKLDSQRLHSLQQGGRQRTPSSSDIVLTSDYLLQTGKRSEKNQNESEPQTYLRGENCLPLPESVSLSRIWTKDVLEKQSNLWTKTTDFKTQANHKEVMVEVLVHEEPGIAEPDKQEGLYGDDGTCWIHAGI